MIYLNKIKVAVFDFDDTLAIHKDKNYIQRRKGSNDYYIQAYLHPDTFYETIEYHVGNKQNRNYDTH